LAQSSQSSHYSPPPPAQIPSNVQQGTLSCSIRRPPQDITPSSSSSDSEDSSDSSERAALRKKALGQLGQLPSQLVGSLVKRLDRTVTTGKDSNWNPEDEDNSGDAMDDGGSGVAMDDGGSGDAMSDGGSKNASRHSGDKDLPLQAKQQRMTWARSRKVVYSYLDKRMVSMGRRTTPLAVKNQVLIINLGK
jgi:hypothetical protein